MKKVFGIAVIALAIVTLTGCSLIPGQKTNEAGKVLEKPAKGNCNVFECIKKLDTKADLETVTKVMGFEGNKLNEGNGYTTYKWVINKEKNEAVQAVFYTSSTTISITFSDEDIKNPKVDFSKFDEIKKAMNNKETVTYDDVKAKFKADGVLIEKSSFSNKYRWVNEKGGYMNANFSVSSGACSMIMGRI
jgi:hypothetical protein